MQSQACGGEPGKNKSRPRAGGTEAEQSRFAETWWVLQCGETAAAHGAERQTESGGLREQNGKRGPPACSRHALPIGGSTDWKSPVRLAAEVGRVGAGRSPVEEGSSQSLSLHH